MNLKRYNKLVLGGAQLGFNYVPHRSNLYKKNNEIKKIFNLGKKYGINKIDTAQAYGKSETNIGLFKKKLSNNIFIVTKLNLKNYNKFNIDLEEYVMNQVSLSLKKLKSKSIDVLMIHQFSDLKKYGINLIFILKKLVKLGFIKEIGISVYSPKELKYSLRFSEIKNIQIPFNIVDTRWLNNALVSIIKKRRIKIFARSLFLKGLLLNQSHVDFKGKKIYKKINNKLNEYIKKFYRDNRIDICLSFANSFNWIKYLVVGFNSKEEFEEILNNFNKPQFKKSEIDLISRDMKKIIDNEKILMPNLWKN